MKKILKISVLLCALFIAFTAGVEPELVLAQGESTVISGHLDAVYYITEPGNYIVEGETGPIWVEASDVHLDLNGGIVNQIEGVANAGLLIDMNQTNVHVNGPGTVLCEGSHSLGIVVHILSSDNHINGVYVKDCRYGGIVVQKSSGNKINGNVVEGICANGIYLGSLSDRNSVVGNTVTDCAIGILVESSSENDIKGNVTNDLAWYGISVDGASINNRFRGNTALNNGVTDMRDINGNCEANSWRGNTFNTADPDCIR